MRRAARLHGGEGSSIPHTDAPAHERLAAADQREHLLGLYDSDDFLVDSLVQFLLPGLHDGGAGVVVATAAHRAALETALGEAGVDVAALRRAHRLVTVDAEVLLASLLVDGAPDPARFRAALGGMLSTAGIGGRPVRIYGEMVTILWERGHVEAVLALERLWNELGAVEHFVLYCAYPLRAFDREESAAGFHAVCDEHSVVLPTEGYAHLTDTDARARAVAVLQQEAIVGINERVARRQVLHAQEEELRRLRALDRLRAELVATLAASHDGGAEAREPRSAVGLQRTAVRQVRRVLAVADCAFAPPDAPPPTSPGGGEVLRVPVASGVAPAGELRVELPPGRRLDADDRAFLEAVAQLVAVALPRDGG